MKWKILIGLFAFLSSKSIIAGNFLHQPNSGIFSLGTRNTISMFSHHQSKPGVGIGGQFRIQLNDRLNTEWYLDWITSEAGPRAGRNDYHIGWSVMYYFSRQVNYDQVIQPYLILGHCFDRSDVFEKNNKSNSISNYSMATQTGIGCHLNITRELDLSFSGQYMLHFGKETSITENEGRIFFESADHSGMNGHLLLTVSANFKFGRLWNN